MMMIEVNNLTKEYKLGSKSRANTFRDLLTGMFKFGGHGTNSTKTLRALNDVSFSVEAGETVGIIGNNGAGKSTLLKILSRIVLPTSGDATLYGRTGSLLEVGTGFHRELSGRENVYLNGAILGMKRIEIEERFDQIVAFAEISEFLETPIKHYSSGMFTRLAFSVAAHLEPEILIVDEVLAVGDLAFQRKCMDKMREVNKEGRTVLFVSHNMQAVTRVCDRAIWIDGGILREDDTSENVVSSYLKTMLNTSSSTEWESNEAPGNDSVKLRRVSVASTDSDAEAVFKISNEIICELLFEVNDQNKPITPGIELVNEQGVSVFTSQKLEPLPTDRGFYRTEVTIPGDLLAEGNYFLSVFARTLRPHEEHFEVKEVSAFMITDPMDGTSSRGDFGGTLNGVIRPFLNWSVEAVSE